MRVGEVVDYSDQFAGSWDEFLGSLDDYSVLEYDYVLDIPVSVAVGDDTFQIPYEEWQEMLETHYSSQDDRREIDYWFNQ